MTPWANRTDANMVEIIAALKRVPGTFVRDLSAAGRGLPDLLVCRHGVLRLLEVKVPDPLALRRKTEDNPTGELTDAQVEFFVELGAAGGRVFIVHTPEEAVRVVASTETEVAHALAGAGGRS